MSDPLRFIVDESTGTAVVEFLRQLGYDVISVFDLMHQAEDTDILRRAFVEKRILITNDKDFGELIYRSGKEHAGVILLRLRDESSANRVGVVRATLENHLDRLQGNFIVATEKKIRLRSRKLL